MFDFGFFLTLFTVIARYEADASPNPLQRRGLQKSLPYGERFRGGFSQ